MPDGTESACGLEGEGVSFVGGGGPQNEDGAKTNWRPGYHMIATTDASRVYFEAKPNKVGEPSKCEDTKPLGLYVRNRETGATTLIDPGTGTHGPEFIRATPDGRHAYFTTYSKLDPADTNVDGDVYRWDEETGTATCLTCAVKNESGEGIADVRLRTVAAGTRLSVVMVSDDFSHVYFESTRALAPGAGAGDPNIYALSGGTVRFVATTTGAGLDTGSGSSQLSADGNVLLFGATPSPQPDGRRSRPERRTRAIPLRRPRREPGVHLLPARRAHHAQRVTRQDVERRLDSRVRHR